MIEEGVCTLRHRDGFINAGPVGVASLQCVRPVILQQNVFAVVDVPLRLAVGDLFNASSQAIVAIGGGERRRGISGHEVFHLRQPILRIIGVLRIVARREQRLAGQVAVIVILVAMRDIRGELIPGIRHIARRRAVPHRIVRETLSRAEQRMAGTR